MARAIWKGAISFGLVHIPVAIASATSSDSIDFDWLDDRSMDPVGYKRINKKTGKEVSKEHIVKGIEYEKGRYVVLTEEEIRTAHPKSTQTIDIFSFLEREQIPLVNIDTPYYLTPDKRGEKVYALLRETLKTSGKVALANIVLHTKQHLAAVMPIESALVLILLRWPTEVRTLESIELNSATTHAQLTKSEKDMAKKLVQGMTAKWNPKEYKDSFQEKIMALVNKKAKSGKIESVEKIDEDNTRKTADIIDLTELLKHSLGGKTNARTKVKSAPEKVKDKANTKTMGKTKKGSTVTKLKSSSNTKTLVAKRSSRAKSVHK